MTDRPSTHGGAGAAPAFEEIAADDAFLDAIAAGDDEAVGSGACGTDAAIAELLVDLRAAVDADLPAPPPLPADFGRAADPEPEPAPGVVPLRRRMLPGRVGSALLGAAAAAVVLVGGAGLVQTAAPGGALWPLREAAMGDQEVSVRLAATLNEADAAAEKGDVESAERLLEHARGLLEQVRAEDRADLEQRMERSRDRVRTVRVTTTVVRDGTTSVVTETAPPETVTETVVETSTETVTETPAEETEPAGGDEPAEPTTTTSTPLQAPETPTAAAAAAAARPAPTMADAADAVQRAGEPITGPR